MVPIASPAQQVPFLGRELPNAICVEQVQLPTLSNPNASSAPLAPSVMAQNVSPARMAPSPGQELLNVLPVDQA